MVGRDGGRVQDSDRESALSILLINKLNNVFFCHQGTPFGQLSAPITNKPFDAVT
jgi:hypothetical protein